MSSDSIHRAPQGHSPHVLNLADRLTSLEGEVTGSIQTVRGAFAPVLQTADVRLEPAQQLAEQRIAAAEKPAAPADHAGAFQPFTARYHGLERAVTSPGQARALRALEQRNERRLRSDPTHLLVDYDGRPDPSLTCTRYAEALRARSAAS